MGCARLMIGAIVKIGRKINGRRKDLIADISSHSEGVRAVTEEESEYTQENGLDTGFSES